MAIPWFALRSILQIEKPRPQKIRNDFISVTTWTQRAMSLPRLLRIRQKPQTEDGRAIISHFISNKVPTAYSSNRYIFPPTKFSPSRLEAHTKLRKVQLRPEGKWLSSPHPSVSRMGRLSPSEAQMPRESMSHKKGCGGGCIINIRKWSLYLCSAGAHPQS